ncbi:MAG: hypothetical protein RIS76_1323 [Verrucomicrobiota bacterium]|jgi:phospholipid/cholesterol/gamma-HCH transport system ATP-binding protein
MNALPVIELVGAGISAEVGAEPLLRGVSWTVFAGDFWVITGSHGSGKSVLLETLAGIRPCAAGNLRWFGQPFQVTGSEDSGQSALRRRLGLVFEGGGRVFSQLSVAENIALPVSYHDGCSMGEALYRTAPLRSALDLDRLAAAPAGRVGRGWMQRVALGRALALQPEVLLLDNPVAGLDPSHLRWWQEFLVALAAGHPVTHGRPVTLVLTADDARPWDGIGRQFAETRDRAWQVLAEPVPSGLEDAISQRPGLLSPTV